MSVSGGSRSYMLLFAVECVGAAMIAGIVIPVYRAALARPAEYAPNPANIVWSIVAMALMQAGFWARRRLRLRPPAFHNALLGQVIQFTGSMTFVLATSIFGFIFITRRPELQFAVPGYMVALLSLFCWFCFTQDLQQLGRSLIGPER